MLPPISLWLLQPAATDELVGAPTGGGGASAPPPAGPDGMMMNLILVAMLALFYFMLLRPQQKRQKELDAMIKTLQKGDKVRTTGGIRGEITELTEGDVTLQIDGKVRINVLRSHIASKIDKPAVEAKA